MHRRVTPGRVIEHLGSWSVGTTVTVLQLAGLALILADRTFPEVGMGPLYIPVIALAGWRLGLGASCAVAALAAALNIYPVHVHELGLDPGVAVARGIVRSSAYAFTIVLIHALRCAYDRERARAARDDLTGALNRIGFEREAEALLHGRDTTLCTLALALIDVDDFKRINDTHGHGAGDCVLRTLASAASDSLAGRGSLGRLGGDEFVVLMPAASIMAGQGAVERLHRDLSTALNWSAHPVTISMGAVVFTAEARRDPAALMQEADRLLYAAKAGGKGRVSVASARVSEASASVTPRSGALRPA